MSKMLNIERVGGYAGFGGPHLKSAGSVDLASLPEHEQAAVDALFSQGWQAGPSSPDEFRYRLTRQTPTGEHTVEVPASAVPGSIESAVKDELV